MRPHVEAERRQRHRRLEPQNALAGRLEREHARLGCVDRPENFGIAAVIMERQIDAEENHDRENESVLDHGVPRRAAHAGDHDVDRHSRGSDPDRRRRRDGAVGGDSHNDSKTLELQHEIGNERDDANHRAKNPEPGAIVFAGEEMRLRHQPLPPRVAPDRRQQPIGENIGQRSVGQDVIGRGAPAVGVTATAQKGEGGVDLSRRQQEDQRRPKTASADRPLLQGHAHAAPGRQAEREGEDRSECDNNEGAVHRTSASRPASGSAFAGSSM